MIKSWLVVFCFVVTQAFANDSLWVVKKPIRKKYKISANTNFDVASNCFNVQTFSVLLNGGTIGLTEKENLSKRILKYNRAGLDFDNHLNIQFKPKRLLRNYFKWLEVGFANRIHSHLGFSKDAINMALNGNTPFLGRTAIMDDLLFNLLQYQQVRLGFASDSNDSLKSKFVFGISLLNGQRNVFFNAPVFRLFTDTNGYSVSGRTNYQISNVPFGMSSFGTNNGLGFSLDIDYREVWSLSLANEFKNIFHINLRDVGFIQWKNNSYNLELDTNFSYKGLEINSLRDSLLWPFTGDSLKSSFLKFNRNAYSSTLPAFFLLENTVVFNEKNQVTLGIRHRALAAYKLQIRVEYEYKFNKKISANGLLTKGGYNNYSVNIGGKFVVFNKAQLNVGINHVQSFFSFSKSGGLGCFAALVFWL